MNGLALSAISLFSGVGMLDEGLRAGLRHLGIAYRTVLHVEREAHAAAVLAARMEEGSVDGAAIWSNVTTLDAAAWHGKVDIVVAGFPCQDLSVAGRRVGLDGKRSGLFFEVVRIATDCGARIIFLENVAGIASATASVMDETEGALDERAAARVVGELADCGWDSEWITLSASDVGASHGRARWFCLAWRMADAEGQRRGLGQRSEFAGRAKTESASQYLDDSNGIRAQRAGRAQQSADSGREELGYARLQHGDVQQRDVRAEYQRASIGLGITAGDGWIAWRAEPTWQQGRSDVAEHGGTVANAGSPRLQGAWRSGGGY